MGWRGYRWFIGATVVALGAACGVTRDGALAPKGPDAERLADLFNVTFWIAVAVYVVVSALVLVALFRRRGQDHGPEGPSDGPDQDDSRRFDNRFVVVGGLAVPAVILLGLMVMTFAVLAQERQEGDLEIRVIGHQFWWEVHYPGFETANELHIPVGVPVHLTLESVDVIHSFWVPELGGKADMVPGRVNDLVVQADEEGEYRGQCAEYCGLQHANMAFLVIAESPEDFEDWAEREAGTAVVEDARGERLFERHACAGCHTIRGTDADGELGPDLTHLASRRSLGAATVDNERAHLTGWVVNSQSIKPGNEMPPIGTLTPDELHELIAYLEALE